jgi:tetratricopeptide (TPR) repeat protein
MVNPYDRLDEILREGASPQTLYLILSRMKAEGHLKRVIQECVRALKVYPHDLHLRRLLAEAYVEDGRWSQAEAEIERAVKKAEELSSLFMLQADIYKRQGRVAEADEALKRALAFRPGDHATPRPSVESETTLDDTTPESTPERVEASQPPPVEEPEEAPTKDVAEIVTPTLAEIYFNQGQVQEAVSTYEKVLEQEPQNLQAGKRLEELTTLLDTGQVLEETTEDPIHQKKAKVINTLETWLGHIRDIVPHSTAP